MQTAPQAVLILGLVAATAWLLRRRSWLEFCGAWFFLILAPTSSFIPLPSEPGAERHYRAYLKSKPDNLEVRYWLVKTLAYQNRSDQALAELIKILARDPLHEKARGLLDALSRKP